MSKKTIFLITFFVLLSVTFLGYAGYVIMDETGSFFGKEKLPVLGSPGHIVGGFSFTDQDGKTVTSNDVKGKIYVAEYFFTTCTGICPKMNKNMEKVYATFKDNPDFRILSHTVDPEHDSVPVLKAYADLYKLARQGYMVDDGTYTGEEDFVHTQWFSLVDGEGRVRGLYEGTKQSDVDKMISDIKRLMEE